MSSRAIALDTRFQRHCAPHGLRGVLGEAAWGRLPVAVHRRFADPSQCAEYAGEFEIVRASRLGKTLAWLCQAIGTPIAPRTGRGVPAVVRVGPTARGVEWRREYHWPDHSTSVVRSTKVIGPSGTLVEELPAGLCMALDLHEDSGALRFVSRSYYFNLSLPWLDHAWHLVLPRWLCPGITCVEHRDESQGWFRFTMTVTHPVLGELFYQTGRFRALGG
jgi:hypothetical protein